MKSDKLILPDNKLITSKNQPVVENILFDADGNIIQPQQNTLLQDTKSSNFYIKDFQFVPFKWTTSPATTFIGDPNRLEDIVYIRYENNVIVARPASSDTSVLGAKYYSFALYYTGTQDTNKSNYSIYQNYIWGWDGSIKKEEEVNLSDYPDNVEFSSLGRGVYYILIKNFPLLEKWSGSNDPSDERILKLKYRGSEKLKLELITVKYS